MAQNAFVQSMKTIAESLIRKAGFDKTRSGKVVGVNSLTNTYSVKVDGHVYNNVRVVNDSTYNVGDTVRVNMPVNQPSQLYISASIYSDASIGKKIGHAESLIDAADREITDIREIMGKIYQLSIRSEYSATGVTHYGVLMQNGEDVTSPEYTVDFHWYLQKVEGKTAIGVGETVTLLKEDFLYGQAVLLEWVVDDNVMLRAQVILFDNTKVEDLAEVAHDAYDIATNEAQYFWFNEDETDNGAHISYYRKDDFESNPRGHNLLANADGVAIRQGVGTLSAFSADGMHVNGMLNNQLQSLANFTKDGIWFNEGIGYTIGNAGAYVKYEYDNGWKIKISADQITLGNQQVATTDMIITDVPYLTEISSGGLFVHRNDSGYAGSDPSSSTAYGVKLASTVDIIRAGKSLATFDENQITFRTKEGYTTATVGTSGFTLYRGASSSSNYAIASFTGNGMTLKNASGVNTLVSNSSGLTIYNGGTSTNVALASFGTSGLTLKNNSGYTTFTVGTNQMIMYTGTSPNYALATFGTGGMTLKNSSGYNTLVTSASALTIYSGNSSNIQIASFSGSGMTLKNSSGYTLCTISGSGMSLNNSSGTNLATFNTSGMTLKNSSGYTICSISGSGMYLYNSSGTTIASLTTGGLYMYSGSELVSKLTPNQWNLGNIWIWTGRSGSYAGYYIDGNNGTNMVLISNASSNKVEFGSQFGRMDIYASDVVRIDSGASGTIHSINTSAFRPTENDMMYLGTSSYRWYSIYAKDTSVNNSDRKNKDVLGNIDFAKDLIMSIEPIRYMWKAGDHRRTRMGFIAQDTAKLCNDMGLNLHLYSATYKAVGDEDEGKPYYGEDVDDNLLNWGMSYEELIAPMVQVIQDQQHTIEDLTQRIEALERN